MVFAQEENFNSQRHTLLDFYDRNLKKYKYQCLGYVYGQINARWNRVNQL